MTDYSELVKKLRDLHRDPRPASAEWLFDNQVALYDAAYAIEDYEHENRRLHGEIEALKAQLPKRGKWLNVTDSYSWYGKCSVCGEEFVVDAYYAGGMNYCPNCGAKTEVQE